MKKAFAAAVVCAAISLSGSAYELRAENTEDHKVTKGDTLWDLSESYLKDPLLWPKIWKLNPQVENPHQISPGQVIKIPTLAEKPEQEATPEAGGLEFAKPAQPEPEPPPPKPKVDMSKEPLSLKVVSKAVFEDAEPVEAIDLSITQKVYDRGIGTVTYSIPQDGRVLHTEGGWTFAADKLRIKINAPGATIGQTYGIYRDLGEVKHPERRKSPGHLVADIGILEVVSIDPFGQVALINKAYTEVEKGDLLGPVPPMPVIKFPVDKSRTDVSGRVLAVHLERSVASADDIVYIDLGKNDGIKPGHRLVVKGLLADEKRSDGEILVLRVTPETASAVVTSKSKHEVYPGDVVGPIL